MSKWTKAESIVLKEFSVHPNGNVFLFCYDPITYVICRTARVKDVDKFMFVGTGYYWLPPYY